MSFNWLSGGSGHAQTLMVILKNRVSSWYGEYPYSRREEFTLSDGGKIFLDFKELHGMGDRPLVFLCLGLVSHSQMGYIQNVVNTLISNESEEEPAFDVCVINYRGLAGAQLATPRVYCAMSTSDFIEPMQYVYQKYCKDQNRRCYAMGFSLGSMILTNAIG